MLLAVGAASALALMGPTSAAAVLSLVAFVLVASLTIAGPVIYYLFGGQRAKMQLDSVKEWLAYTMTP